jgi:hypothetical protein
VVARLDVVVAVAVALLVNLAAAEQAADVDLLYGSLRPAALTPELEDACFSAQELGFPAPWLFGVALAQRTYIVSLFAGRGRMTLGTMAFRQDALPYPEDAFEVDRIYSRHNTKPSNQAMQLTASKPAIYASRACHRAVMLRGMHEGLAAADLVSR